MELKKILFIDPWGINGLEEYSNNLLNNLDLEKIEITYLGNFHLSNIPKTKFIPHYFKFTEKFPPGLLRKFLRFIEYFCNQIHLLCIVSKKNKYHKIHLQWSLFFLLDIPIYWIIRKINYDTEFILTLHNSVNHTIKDVGLRLSFSNLFNLVIVHGNNEKKILTKRKIKAEVKVVPHGNKKVDISSKIEVPYEIKKLKLGPSKIYLFFGHLKSNKGIADLIKYWENSNLSQSEKLIIAGKPHGSFKLHDFYSKDSANIIIIDRFVNKNEMRCLFELCDLVILPYKQGSISGVLFTASAFKKPVLSTNFGSISEYIINLKTSFIVNESEFYIKLNDIIYNYSKNELQEIGENNYYHLKDNFSWKAISEKYNTIYLK